MIGKLLDLIWPRSCAVCGRPADRPGRHLCSDCLMRLEFRPVRGLCRLCGREAVGFTGEFLCSDCKSRRPHFFRAASVFDFENVARELVNSFKFRGAVHLRDDLVDFLEAVVRARHDVPEISAVVPMPTTIVHRLVRGYNPCEVLAKALAERLGKPYRRLLKRVGNPKRQGLLNEAERLTNVIGTFALRHHPRSCAATPSLPPVLLLDDIMTTGSTLSEASRVLKLAGYSKVYTVSLARSVRV